MPSVSKMKLKRIGKNQVGLVELRHETQQIIECHERLMLGFTYVQPTCATCLLVSGISLIRTVTSFCNCLNDILVLFYAF